jgi:acetate kinase
MSNPLLILNAGSSSVKFSIFETAEDRSLTAGFHGSVEEIETAPHFAVSTAAGAAVIDRKLAACGHDAAIAAIHDWFADHVGSEDGFAGVGHRVVHGGRDHVAPCLVTEALLDALDRLSPLAPLHQPHNLAAIRAVASVAPHVPQIACFDTAFHAGQPEIARRFALPRSLTEQGVVRYGFHGLSYEYVSGQLPALLGEAAQGRIVMAHLGNGASLCAIDQGRSVATTMGFTALDGLPMGTRCGALDPGVILYLLQNEQMSVAAIEDLLYRRSGLLGMSGISSDMRALLASGSPAAQEAVDLFIYRIGREIGSLAAALGGLDALVFTGGIGEHAAPVRAGICRAAAWLALHFDAAANQAGASRISAPASPVSAWVIPTDENLMIARHTRDLLDRTTERNLV